jgi:hypothetical protein
MLIARIYETFPLACPVCGATMRIIAFDVQGCTNDAGGRMPGAAITETGPVHRILDHIGEPPSFRPADHRTGSTLMSRSSWTKISIRTATRSSSING